MLSKPTHRKHNPWHDYHEACIYHITLVCSDRVPVLGKIVGESVEKAHVVFTPLGKEVAHAIQDIPYKEFHKGNDVQILAAVTMPEHLHFVLYVRKPMKEKMGTIIRGFKQGCNKALRRWLERAGMYSQEMANSSNCDARLSTSEVYGSVQSLSGAESFPYSEEELAFLRQLRSISSPRLLQSHALFEEDFDETRLIRRGQLSTMIAYVHNNAKHRWLKSRHRNLLIPMRGIDINGRLYDGIGNVNLLALPRHQVWVRSRWTDEERRNYKNGCIIKARQGAALVSPFISPHEAAVRDVALKEGHSVIVITDNGFTDFTQCPGGLYDYCVNGQVLILVPSSVPHLDYKHGITREECVKMNEIAKEICESADA